MNRSSLTIHQTVHGYRAGHELLASSRTLPVDTQRTMVVHSDLSGPNVVLGFEEYITGYPLEELHTYVLARTWYAPEMERPGCVWTHSLLIDFADLAHIVDLSLLTRYFRRPSRTLAADVALPAISVFASETRAPATEERIPTIATILGALYGSPETTIILTTADPDGLEPLVFAVWSQQWPRLRRAFRFCTGALSAREQEGGNFDLLVSPKSLESSLRRELPVALFTSDVPSMDLFWLSAARTTMSSGNSAANEFFSAFGADILQPRRAWLGLFDAYQLAQRKDVTALDIIELLSSRFPTPRDAQRLKKAALWEGAITAVDASDMLLALASCTNPDAFDVDVLSHKDLCFHALLNDRAAVAHIIRNLLTVRLNSLGESILRDLCVNVDSGAFKDIARTQPGLIPVIISHSPSLATAHAAWDISLNSQREMLSALIAVGNDAVRQALPTIVAHGADELAMDVARAFRENTASEVLHAITSGHETLATPLRASWRHVLAWQPSTVVEWLHSQSVTSERFLLAVSILEPEMPAVQAVSPAVWLADANQLLAEVAAEDCRTSISTFLLALACSTTEPEGAQLMCKTFSTTYEAARADRLPYALWRWLEDALPPISKSRWWDRCERLCAGLVRLFIERGWPLQTFVESVPDPLSFFQTLSVAEGSNGGRKLIKRIYAEAATGGLHLSPAQRDILWRRQ